jgi:hypothetical protein
MMPLFSGKNTGRKALVSEIDHGCESEPAMLLMMI